MKSHLVPQPQIPPSAKRYEGLDQLRGLLAFSVMVYHYAEWHRLPLPWHIQRPLNLLGIYAVCTFYTLSGSALYIVYRNREINRSFASEFWIKRVFRIIPLFWLVSTIALLTETSSADWNLWKIFLNYSLLFSWIDPHAYFATGAWSIGNEWAFYTLFPLILWSTRSRVSSGLLIAAVILVTSWYAFHVLSPAHSVEEQWKSYIQPLNHLILFSFGVVIGPSMVRARLHPTFPARVYGAALVFILASYLAEVPTWVSGFGRFLLVAVCLVCCQGFAVTQLKKGNLSKSLTFLGSISYTMYLMHPIVHHGISKVGGKIQSIIGKSSIGDGVLSGVVFSGSVIATIFISMVVYRYLETPAIALGKRLSKSSKLSALVNRKLSSPVN
ncbi:MAG: acyltransferase [Luteolibacter sp.]|uniref:acyltransferase family protein n=1 Tax=Luteolibacter sp. TaxID=1962973 RepID=UPI003265F1F2